jgi:hypothetical protein
MTILLIGSCGMLLYIGGDPTVRVWNVCSRVATATYQGCYNRRTHKVVGAVSPSAIDSSLLQQMSAGSYELPKAVSGA